MLMSKSKLTKTGGDRHTITWKYDGVLTAEQAMDIQEKEGGYAIPGYGFFSFKCDGKVSTWASSASCD
jgi:hypothetical protein